MVALVFSYQPDLSTGWIDRSHKLIEYSAKMKTVFKKNGNYLECFTFSCPPSVLCPVATHTQTHTLIGRASSYQQSTKFRRTQL